METARSVLKNGSKRKRSADMDTPTLAFIAYIAFVLIGVPLMMFGLLWRESIEENNSKKGKKKE